MNKALSEIVNNFAEIMKNTSGVLGAWDFGSVSRGMSDEYSDADIVFLADGDKFVELAKELEANIARVCEKVLICWEESFNGDAIINNGYLIQKGDGIFQLDVFLLNYDKIDDYICRIHYSELTEKDILFDLDGKVKALCGGCSEVNLWSGDLDGLFKTYLYHFYMTGKYIVRKDYFKLNYVMRTLFDTHASVLLTAYDRISWGGEGNKLGFLPKEKREHLMVYFCCGDFEVNRGNLLKGIDFFGEDFREVKGDFDFSGLDLVRVYWERITEKM